VMQPWQSLASASYPTKDGIFPSPRSTCIDEGKAGSPSMKQHPIHSFASSSKQSPLPKQPSTASRHNLLTTRVKFSGLKRRLSFLRPRTKS
jgi:hypothetical protein